MKLTGFLKTLGIQPQNSMVAACHPPPLMERIKMRFTYWYNVEWMGYYSKQGEPLRCPYCDRWHWEDHKEHTVDSINGIPCEIETVCKCGHRIAYWAYGYYEPPFV